LRILALVFSLCRWSANYGRFFVVYYRIAQSSRLNLGAPVLIRLISAFGSFRKNTFSEERNTPVAHFTSRRCAPTIETVSKVSDINEDAGLAINDKTKILVKGISAADTHAAAQRLLIAHPSLAHPSPLLSPASFVVDGYIGLGVPIGLMLLSSTL